MTARQFRILAERCRALRRVAVGDDIREQLRNWAIESDAEAEAIETARDREAVERE